MGGWGVKAPWWWTMCWTVTVLAQSCCGFCLFCQSVSWRTFKHDYPRLDLSVGRHISQKCARKILWRWKCLLLCRPWDLCSLKKPPSKSVFVGSRFFVLWCMGLSSRQSDSLESLCGLSDLWRTEGSKRVTPHSETTVLFHALSSSTQDACCSISSPITLKCTQTQLVCVCVCDRNPW